jgi:hypothetical protein
MARSLSDPKALDSIRADIAALIRRGEGASAHEMMPPQQFGLRDQLLEAPLTGWSDIVATLGTKTTTAASTSPRQSMNVPANAWLAGCATGSET